MLLQSISFLPVCICVFFHPPAPHLLQGSWAAQIDLRLSLCGQPQRKCLCNGFYMSAVGADEDPTLLAASMNCVDKPQREMTSPRLTPAALSPLLGDFINSVWLCVFLVMSHKWEKLCMDALSAVFVSNEWFRFSEVTFFSSAIHSSSMFTSLCLWRSVLDMLNHSCSEILKVRCKHTSPFFPPVILLSLVFVIYHASEFLGLFSSAVFLPFFLFKCDGNTPAYPSFTPVHHFTSKPHLFCSALLFMVYYSAASCWHRNPF